MRAVSSFQKYDNLSCLSFRLTSILKAEEAFSKGKVLNEEQIKQLASKQSIERSLQDCESIRIQLEEVAALGSAGLSPEVCRMISTFI